MHRALRLLRTTGASSTTSTTLRALGASAGTRSASSSAVGPFQAWAQGELAGIRAAGTWKGEEAIASPQAASITLTSSTTPVLNFCANNYLGLSADSEVLAAAEEGVRSRGFGMSSVRFICGTGDGHVQLEKAIADFHKTDSTILFPSCFDANAGLFEVILGKEDAVISDALNHASIIDGIRLCKAQRFRYKHADMADLEAQLQAASGARRRLIATDGVFSMDGTIAPLREICDLADKYDALVFIDECHATGFLGENGRGTPELAGVEGRVHFINSTLGKALGGASGGYVTSTIPEAIDLLRQRARPYLFSNAVAPPIVAASLKVFDILGSTRGAEMRRRIRENTDLFRGRMRDAGFDLKPGDHPIVPVMLYDDALATEFGKRMVQKGIYVVGFSYPVVPKGQARIRVQLSAAHTTEMVNRAVDTFIEVRDELKAQ